MSSHASPRGGSVFLVGPFASYGYQGMQSIYRATFSFHDRQQARRQGPGQRARAVPPDSRPAEPAWLLLLPILRQSLARGLRRNAARGISGPYGGGRSPLQ